MSDPRDEKIRRLHRHVDILTAGIQARKRRHGKELDRLKLQIKNMREALQQAFPGEDPVLYRDTDGYWIQMEYFPEDAGTPENIIWLEKPPTEFRHMR